LVYTSAYGRTYLEWAELKAKRIHEVLEAFYERHAPLDLQDLTLNVYFERLNKVSKEYWKPIYGFPLDKKPSAFIKNFIEHLIDRMNTEGYVEVWFTVEASARGVTKALSTRDIYEVPNLISETKNLLVEELGEEVLGEIDVSVKREIRILHVPNLEWLIDLCIWRDPEH
jgi:hypothetical protein